jgi:hypothetical protein
MLRADDVYAAALVIFQIGTGEDLVDGDGAPETAAGMRNRLAAQGAVIRDLLSHQDRRTRLETDNAFADSPAGRPQIRTLDARWRPASPADRSALRREIDRREAQAREDFARLRERQGLVQPPPDRSGPRPARTHRTAATTAATADGGAWLSAGDLAARSVADPEAPPSPAWFVVFGILVVLAVVGAIAIVWMVV